MLQSQVAGSCSSVPLILSASSLGGLLSSLDNGLHDGHICRSMHIATCRPCIVR